MASIYRQENLDNWATILEALTRGGYGEDFSDEGEDDDDDDGGDGNDGRRSGGGGRVGR